MGNKKFISSIWSYDSKINSAYMTHGLYRWYGKLLPQLVGDVLDLYTEKNDTVVANFSGSGTIALEAMIRNLDFYGTDINPLAILVSKVKTQKIHIEDVDALTKSIIDYARSIEDKVETSHLYQPEKWYSDGDPSKLVSLKKAIDALISDESIKNFYYVVLASITRECSKIDSRCVNHIVVDADKSTKEVYSSFSEASISSYTGVASLNDIAFDSSIRIFESSADDMSYLSDESVDLVFSHPPYLNAVNYYNIYRLSTDLLEMNYSEIRKKDFSAKKLDDFLSFMEKSFAESYRVLKKGKRCVVVIGDIRYKGNITTLQVEFINLLKKVGFDIEDIFIWELAKKAGMNVARRGNHIDHNYIIVAKKGEQNGKE